MLDRWCRHARANVVGYLALFVALGGTSYAAVRIDGRLLKPNSVRGKAIAPNTLGGREISERRLGLVPRAAAADRAKTAGRADLADSATRAAAADRADSAGSADRAAAAGSADRAAVADRAASADDAAKLGGLAPSAFAAAGHVVFGRAAYEPDDTARSVLHVPGFFELFTSADNDAQFDLAIASRNGSTIIILGPNASNNTISSSTTPADGFGVLIAPTPGRILTFTVNDATRQAALTCGFGPTNIVVCSALVS